MAEAKGNITEFRISLRDRECLKPRFVGVLEPIKDRIHQSADFSDVYYTPSDVYAELEAMCVAAVGKLRFLKTISTESVVVLHCSTYVKNFNYVQEESNTVSYTHLTLPTIYSV